MICTVCLLLTTSDPLEGSNNVPSLSWFLLSSPLTHNSNTRVPVLSSCPAFCAVDASQHCVTAASSDSNTPLQLGNTPRHALCAPGSSAFWPSVHPPAFNPSVHLPPEIHYNPIYSYAGPSSCPIGKEIGISVMCESRGRMGGGQPPSDAARRGCRRSALRSCDKVRRGR